MFTLKINAFTQKPGKYKLYKPVGDDVTASTPIVRQHGQPVAPSSDCLSNIKQSLLYVYGLMGTSASNLSSYSFDPIEKILWRKIFTISESLKDIHGMPCRCLSGPFHRCCCSARNWRRHCFVRPTPEDCATAVTNNNFVQCPCNSTVTVSL